MTSSKLCSVFLSVFFTPFGIFLPQPTQGFASVRNRRDPHITLHVSGYLGWNCWSAPVRTFRTVFTNSLLSTAAGGFTPHEVTSFRHQPPVSHLATVDAQLSLEGQPHLLSVGIVFKDSGFSTDRFRNPPDCIFQNPPSLLLSDRTRLAGVKVVTKALDNVLVIVWNCR